MRSLPCARCRQPESEAAIRICEVVDERMGEIGGLRLTYRPLEVQARLQSDLFEVWPRVVCTSATLALGSDLSWFQRNIGAVSEKGRTALVRIPSPFDYKSHVLIYTPLALSRCMRAQPRSGICRSWRPRSDGWCRRAVAERLSFARASVAPHNFTRPWRPDSPICA